MTNIDAEGGLGIELDSTQWIPLYFTSEEEANKCIFKCGRQAISVYFTENGKAIYHEADHNRFVIFVLRQEAV